MDNQVKDTVMVGRRYEQEQLLDMYGSPETEMAVVYGRRRVGKTFLVKETFKGRFDFVFTGVYKKSAEVQLELFSVALEEYSERRQPTPKDWYEAFRQLKDYLKGLPAEDGRKRLVFIDEIAWLDTPYTDFMGAFEAFWNGWGALQDNLMLVVCASATSWMTKKFFRHKGGLFNRGSKRLYINPFTLRETEQYLLSRGIEWTRYDILETYMIMGGIPFYLKQLSPRLTFTQNIDTIFFKRHGLLSDEFKALYDTLFEDSEQYLKIIKALQRKRIGLTRNEIVKAAKMHNNGVLTNYLEDLTNCGFVRSYCYFGKQKQDTMYQLCDYYTIFYLTYIEEHYGRDELYWTNAVDDASRRAWCGYGFEQVCKDHILQIRQKLGISGVLSDCSSWFSKGEDGSRGAQIDLVIDRRDRVISLCEMKFSGAEFTIDRQYDEQLRQRKETFRTATRTKKDLQTVLVTTYGLVRNAYSQRVQEVTIDDLFKEI